VNAVTLLNVLLDQLEGPGDATSLQQYIQQFLTWPIVWFQANALSSSPVNVSSAAAPVVGLPSSLYVTAALAQTKRRSVITPWTAIVFLCIAVMVILWCVIEWWRSSHSPELSAFPLLDFAMIFDEKGPKFGPGAMERFKGPSEFREDYERSRLVMQ
jgi:hypothetical protein